MSSHKNNKDINVDFVFQNVAPLFSLEWTSSSRDDITVTQFQSSGYSTRMWIIENHRAVHEPKKVLLRLYGGNTGPKQHFIDSEQNVTEAEEAVILFEQSRRGDGPKLYGLIPGGRIEEFIESHTLTADEASDPLIMTDMAKAYARLHHSDFPIKKDRWKKWFNIPDIQRNAYSMPEVQATGIDFDTILSLDLDKEVKFVLDALSRVESQFSFIHQDSHYANVLVRDEVRDGQLRVVLVDYECVMYGPRAFDLAAHFLSRMIDQKGVTSKINDREYPTEEERRFVIREYLKEVKRIKGQLDKKVDTEDHLMMEVEVGILGWTLSVLFLIHSTADSFVKDPPFFTCVEFLYKMYVLHKPNVEALLCR